MVLLTQWLKLCPDNLHYGWAMSLYCEYESTNVLAKILNQTLPCAPIYEDDHHLAFMDAFPQTKGHCLVIPKRAACNLFDLKDEHLGSLIITTQKIARAVRDALKPDGIQIMQFNGEAAGQTVFHLHFHIIPRWHDMTLKSHAKGIMAPLDELKETAARIKAQL